jgi:competence protein ComGC
MRKDSFLHKVFDLYYDGFRSMRLGRTLWAIILIKLFIIFVVLKLFFFPNFLKQNAKGNEAGYVATELTDRAAK